MRLKNKSIVITGSTSGIGKAIAEKVIAEGGQVLIHGIVAEEGQELVKKLGTNAKLCIADLKNSDSPKQIVNFALDAFGKIDGLVNNAAIFPRDNLHQLSEKSFAETMMVNLQSALFLIQAAYPYLKAQKGTVLNIGSINAYSGESSLLAYSISKGGMQTMTRNLANALGTDGVRFNQINPGWILTEREYRDQIKKGLPEGWPEKLGKDNIPFGKMSTPEQLANAAIYWLGDESRPFTGAVIELEQFSIIGRNPEK
jgi:NAD(P)-dependent dehydrogenase (short-subunit alcohol dehydrogenase family)